MIFDSLSSSGLYEGLSARFARAFQWLRSVDVAALPDGKTLLDEDLSVLVQRGLSKPLEETKWEAHRLWADIQYVAAGREIMHWQSLGNTRPGPYVLEKDFVPLETDDWTALEVSAGRFTVFFPTDAHRPSILIPGADPVVKLVVKVRL